MKNRDYKQFARGAFAHVYNRGNNKEKIFYDEEDYKAFLYRLSLALGFEIEELSKHPMTQIPHSRVRIIGSKKGDFKLHAFCLMKNHFHLLLEQCSETPIYKPVSKLCTSYAMYINKKYGRVGHVFQDRFKSVLIESEPQLMWVSAYIHTNPIKSGHLKHPREYKWSSYKDYSSEKRGLPFVYTKMLASVFKNDFERAMSRVPLDTIDSEVNFRTSHP